MSQLGEGHAACQPVHRPELGAYSPGHLRKADVLMTGIAVGKGFRGVRIVVNFVVSENCDRNIPPGSFEKPESTQGPPFDKVETPFASLAEAAVLAIEPCKAEGSYAATPELSSDVCESFSSLFFFILLLSCSLILLAAASLDSSTELTS
jgi:hypothetical protein